MKDKEKTKLMRKLTKTNCPEALDDILVPVVDDKDSDDDDVRNDDSRDDDSGVHPNSHKHFIPYMGFCASIWDSVRHHCHHCHHHHQKRRCERTALEQILIRTPPLPSLNKVDS